MANSSFPSAVDEMEKIKSIAGSAEDRPVVMVNINRYRPEADFPNGEIYREYFDPIERVLASVNARTYGRMSVEGCVICNLAADEMFSVWFASNQVFLNVHQSPDTPQFYEVQGCCVSDSVILRCHTTD